MKRVGFIINSRVPEVASLRKGMLPHALIAGWDDAESPMSFMRFHWIASALRSRIHYELYRPWRRYDAVVFLKSMGGHCMKLARKLRKSGTRVVFEANVDYYTPFDGHAEIDAIIPTERQRAEAQEITEFADLVIGSSRHLTEVCRAVNSRSEWIPDNVNLDLIRTADLGTGDEGGRLNVWWSGMASKAFELLVAEEGLLASADRIHLHLVTDNLPEAALGWSDAVQVEMAKLLSRLRHTIHPFKGISDLLGLYSRGGVIISPRSLDSPYNHSHTEWKLTLGMAVGLPAIGSAVPSYVDVRERSDSDAMRICKSAWDWREALDSVIEDPQARQRAGEAARMVVAEYYETSRVASRHADLIESVIAGK